MFHILEQPTTIHMEYLLLAQCGVWGVHECVCVVYFCQATYCRKKSRSSIKKKFQYFCIPLQFNHLLLKEERRVTGTDLAWIVSIIELNVFIKPFLSEEWFTVKRNTSCWPLEQSSVGLETCLTMPNQVRTGICLVLLTYLSKRLKFHNCMTP